MKTFISIFLFVLFAKFAFGGVINVPGDQATIQAGIDAATDGDTVLVSENTYFENINYKGKAITVASHFILDQDTSHISNTIIDGSQPSHPDSGSVVLFNSGEDTTSVLYGFTITGGTGQKIGIPNIRVGGGINLIDAGASIRNNFIVDNSVNDFSVDYCFGGGICSGPPEVTKFLIIEHNLIQYNTCQNAGIACHGAGMYIISNSRIDNNIVQYNQALSATMQAAGGGMMVNGTESVIITNNRIIRNKAITNSTTTIGAGGGAYFYDNTSANLLIQGNTFAYNEVKSGHVADGGGVSFENCNGNILFSNNLVYGNYYSGPNTARGGGIYLTYNSDVSIINNTITGNTASYGGGLCSSISESSVLINNILWGNTAQISDNEINIYSGNPPTITYCDVQGGWPGEGNINSDPMFADTLFHLSDSSKCIGMGIDEIQIDGVWYFCPSVDFEVTPRPYPFPFDYNVDIGADESEYSIIFVHPGDTDNNGVVDANDVLPIGIYFLNDSADRDSIGIIWKRHRVTPWEIPASTFADANGDGLVDEKDVIAIGVNWGGNTHFICDKFSNKID